MRTSESESPSAACPVCESSARQVAEHPDAFLHRCPSCTHCFSVLKASVENEPYDDRYYDDDHRRWFEHPNLGLFRRVAEGILGGRDDLSVLDVGCGRGDFLAYLRREHPRLSLTGIELSQPPPIEGVRLLQGDVLSTRIEGRFDAVVSLAVIEHIPDVRSFTERLVELCRPGGVICVMTVNEASVLYDLARAFRRLGAPLAFNRLYMRHHLHHFTIKSLGELLRRGGAPPELAYAHNGLLAATDIPVASPVADALLRGSVAAIMLAGRVTGRMYLQTVICRRSAEAAEAHPEPAQPYGAAR